MSDGIPPAPPIPVIPKAPAIPPPPPPPPPTIQGSKKSPKTKEHTTSNVKLRRLIWNKIPTVQIGSDENIWSASNNSENRTQLSVDIDTINELFAVRENPAKVRSPSPRGKKPKSSLYEEGKTGPITLLDTKQSMNINIFLRQFKRSVQDVVSAIAECDTSILSADKLRTLFKLLPEKDDLKKLEEFKGDVSQLDDADKFILGIIKVPSYKLRIECAILRDEYTPAIKEIEESFQTLQHAMTEIRECVALPSILHLVLQTGNYLNQGVSYGNAAGFRLDSLKKLADTKANRPGITMMHYVAMELEKQDHKMMNWTENIPSLSSACRISLSMVREELAVLRKKVQTLKDCVTRDKDEDLKRKMMTFMEMADCNLGMLLEKERKVENTTKDLAIYLCEKPSQFSLEECFSIVDEFRNKFNQAAKENARKEKLKAKRERNRILSSQSFTALSSATNLTVPEPEISRDDVHSGARSKRRNTIEIPRRRGHSPKPGRPFSEPANMQASALENVINEDVDQLHTHLDSRLDLKAKRVILTKLEPIQTLKSENVRELTLPQERQTAWGVAYVSKAEPNTRQINPTVTRSSAPPINDETSEQTTPTEGYERVSRRRYRSLRSVDAHDDSRERRDFYGSTNSLNIIPSDNTRESTPDQSNTKPAETKTDMECMSARERFNLRHSGRRVRTDLQLAEDTYVTRTGEILPLSSAKSRWLKSEEVEDGNSKRRSRNDDLRERIRKYKEKNKLQDGETEGVSKDLDSEDFTFSRPKPRPTSDGGSVTRLSHIFETARSISYSPDNEGRRRDEIISDKTRKLDMKIEDVATQDDDTTTVFSPVRLQNPLKQENESSPLLGEKSQDTGNEMPESKPQDEKIKSSSRKYYDSNEENDDTLPKGTGTDGQNQAKSNKTDVKRLYGLNNLSNNSNSEHKEIVLVVAVSPTIEHASETILLSDYETSQTENNKIGLEAEHKETVTPDANIKVTDETLGKSDFINKALKSGVSEVLNGYNTSINDVCKNNDASIINENIQAEDAFSLLAEKELENVEVNENNASDNIESNICVEKKMSSAEVIKNTENTMKSLGEDLKNMNAKLQSKRSPVKSSSPATSVRRSASTTGHNLQTKSTRAATKTRTKPLEVSKTGSTSTVTNKTKTAAKSESKTPCISESQNSVTKTVRSSETVKSPKASSKKPTETTIKVDRTPDSTRRVTKSTKPAQKPLIKAETISSNNTSNTTRRPPSTSAIRSSSMVRGSASRRSVLNSPIGTSPGLGNRIPAMRNSTNSLHTIGRNPSVRRDRSTLPHHGKKAAARVPSLDNTLPRTTRKAATPISSSDNTSTPTRTNQRLSTGVTLRGDSSTLPRTGRPKSTITSGVAVRNNNAPVNSPQAGAVRPTSMTSTDDVSTKRKPNQSDKEVKKVNAPSTTSTTPTMRNNTNSLHTIGRNTPVRRETSTNKPSPVTIEYLPRAKMLNGGAASTDSKQKSQVNVISTKINARVSSEKTARRPATVGPTKALETSEKKEPVKKTNSANSSNQKRLSSNTNVVKNGGPNSTKDKEEDRMTKKTPTKSTTVPSRTVDNKRTRATNSETVSAPEQPSPTVDRKKSTKAKSVRNTATPAHISPNVVRKHTKAVAVTPPERPKHALTPKNSTEVKQEDNTAKTKLSKTATTASRIWSRTSPKTDLKKPKQEINKDVLSKKSTTKPNNGVESSLRSSSSSNLTSSRPTSSRREYPPSSFRPLRNSISARSTSSLSSSSSNTPHCEVYMTRTATLRLSRLKLNRK